MALTTCLMYAFEKNKRAKTLIISAGTLLPLGIQLFMVSLALVLPNMKYIFAVLLLYILFLILSVFGLIVFTNKKIISGFYGGNGKKRNFGTFQSVTAVWSYLFGLMLGKLFLKDICQEKLIYYIVFPLGMFILCVIVLCSTIPAYKYFLFIKYKDRW